MDWLNYHQLLNFWLVAREGSVRRAAELLHVTPASVSIQVRQLERSLGAKLIQKDGRGIAITELGMQVAEYASDIFSKGQELVDMVQGRPLGKPLVLRVGVRDIMPKHVAFRLLQPALELDQQVRLNYIEGTLDRLVSELSIHKLDVVLSDIPLDSRYKIQAYSHHLGQSGVVFLATAAVARKYRPNFPESLAGAPLLLQSSDSAMRRQLDQWFVDREIPPHVVGEFADSAMMKIAAKSGLGVIAVPSTIEAEVKRSYGLQRIGEPQGVIEHFYAISIERKIKHPSVLAIHDASVALRDP